MTRAARPGDIDSLPADASTRQAWSGVPASVEGVVVCGRAGALVANLREPLTGGLQVTLQHLAVADPSAVRQLASYAEEHAVEPGGWLAVELPVGSPLEEVFREAGFTPVDVQLHRPPTTPTPVPWPTRPARPADRESIAKLAAEVLSDVLGYPPGCSHAEVAPRYTTLHTEIYVVDAPDGTLAGFISLDEDFLDDLAVARPYWGRRVAHALLQAAGTRELWATVSHANPRSWKPALRAGFRAVSRRWARRF